MKNVRILFIHKLIYDYRLSFYEQIASVPEYDVTVLHSGKIMRKPDSNFREIIVPENFFTRILWQKGALNNAQNADVVIALFDVHYLSTIFLGLLPRKFKLIFWGIGFGKSRVANHIRLFLARKADALALYMPGNMRDFTDNGIPSSKIFCTPNTIHIENPFFNENIMEKDHFLFLGGLKKRKKIDEFIMAFKKALPSFTRPVHMDIIGEGEMMVNLKYKVNHLALNDFVTFHGAITDNEKLAPFFRRAIAIVSPGQAGLTILHGFAHGVPMVTYRHAISGGELENIVHGTNGILYGGSVNELTSVLIKLANNSEHAHILGRNAYEYYINEMTLNHLITSFKKIIDFVQRKGNGQ